MRRISCSKADEWIVANLDEGLPPERREILNGHLRECPKCRQRNEQTESLLATLLEDMPENPCEEFWTRFETTFQARLEEQYSRSWWVLPWRKVGLVAAAAVVLLAVGLRTRMPRSPEYVTRPPSANLVIQELYMMYSPLSEDIVTVEYDPAESAYDGNLQSLYEEQALQVFDDDDDPAGLLL